MFYTSTGFEFREESRELPLVKASIGSHAAAHVKAERPDSFHCFPHILCAQAAGQKNRDANLLANLSADCPIMPAACAAKLFDGQRLVAGIEQYRVDVRRNSQGFVQGLFAPDVYDLNQGDARHGRTHLLVTTPLKPVANLDRIHIAATLLLNNGSGILT
jgi:hypothetical protein